MDITLNTSELMFDIRNKSHLETAKIPDAEQRYIIEAGSDKKDELERRLIEAYHMARQLCARYLVPDVTVRANDSLSIPEAFVFRLNLSTRRLSGKTGALAQMLHSFICNHTLAGFYATVSQPELSASHSNMANVDAMNVENILYNKMPPMK